MVEELDCGKEGERMSCPECGDGGRKLEWRWKVGVVCLVGGILVNYVELPKEWKAQSWIELLSGLLLGSAVALLVVAFFRSRNKGDE
jgi:hypothetical protein